MTKKLTEREHKENATQILNVLITYAPNETAKRIVMEEISRDTKSLASALIDGLLYGNWPWISFNAKD